MNFLSLLADSLYRAYFYAFKAYLALFLVYESLSVLPVNRLVRANSDACPA